MTDPFSGYYEQSYPPSVLRRPTPPLVGATARDTDDGEVEAAVEGDELTPPELVAADEDADGEALPDAPAQDGATPLPVAAAKPRKRREQDRRHDDEGAEA